MFLCGIKYLHHWYRRRHRPRCNFSFHSACRSLTQLFKLKIVFTISNGYVIIVVVKDVVVIVVFKVGVKVVAVVIVIIVVIVGRLGSVNWRRLSLNVVCPQRCKSGAHFTIVYVFFLWIPQRLDDQIDSAFALNGLVFPALNCWPCFACENKTLRWSQICISQLSRLQSEQ